MCYFINFFLIYGFASRYNNQLSVLRSELRSCKRKATEQAKQISDQQKLLAEQQKQTLEYANRLDANDKKNEEMSRKFSSLLQVIFYLFRPLKLTLNFKGFQEGFAVCFAVETVKFALRIKTLV